MVIGLKENLSFNKSGENNFVLIDPEQGKYYRLNKSGMEIVDILKGEKDIEEIAKQLSEKYGISQSLIIEDVESFVKKLMENGFIYEKGNETYIEKKEEMGGLDTLWIKVTNKCNLHCPYCYAESGITIQNNDEITLDEIEKLLETAKSMGLERIVITGGEPLVRKDIVDILKLAKKYGLVQLLSNGTIYDEKILSEVVNYVDIIQFSLDSYHKEVHDGIRGQGSFEKTMKSTKYLRDIGFKNIVFAATPTPTNDIDLRKMIDLCLENGARRLHVNRYIPLGRAKDYKNFDLKSFYIKADEAYSYINELYQNSLRKREVFDFSIDISGDLIDSIKSVTRKYSCGLNKAAISIDSNGEVYLCQAMHHKNLVIGNVREEALDNIMKKSEKKFGDFNVNNIEKCRKCDVKYWCGGGCKAFAVAINGDITKEDPQCCSHRERVLDLMGRMIGK